MVTSGLMQCQRGIVALSLGVTSLDAVTPCFRVECVVSCRAVAVLEVHRALFRAVSLSCGLTVVTACVELLAPQ